MGVEIVVEQASFSLAREFRISRGAKTQADVVVVSISENGLTGRGESVPYARYGETLPQVLDQLNAVTHITSLDALTKASALLQAGSARNALDCAIWDLTVQKEQRSIHHLTGLPSIQGCHTAQTLSIETPDAMYQAALELQGSPLIKIKLDDNQIIERMEAVHRALPESKFIVDANEGWSFALLQNVAPALAALNVVLLEQPLAAKDDACLAGYQCPITLCADESCHTAEDIPRLAQRYQAVNIKLDKTGGLTEAMQLLHTAKRANMEIMVGCMVATSLAMAPAYALCAAAQYVDLDGPLLVAEDRPNGFEFQDGWMSKPKSLLWGEPR